MDRKIELIVRIDGKKVESSRIVSHLEQMEYNEWNKVTLMNIGNLKLELKRTKESENKEEVTR